MPVRSAQQEFSERFREALLRAGHGRPGLTELAEALAQVFDDAPSLQTVHKWLSGIAIPRARRLAGIARWLNVSEHWLANGPDPQATQDKLPSAAPREWARRIDALTDSQQAVIELLLVEFERHSLD